MNGLSGWMWIWMPLMMVISLGLFFLMVIGTVWIARRIWPTENGAGTLFQKSQAGEPLQILKRRYAKGEIDRDAFRQMKEDLLD